MRKILFVIPSMRIGGAEKSLVNLLNLIDLNKYDVNLLMFKPEGDFLQQIPYKITSIDQVDRWRFFCCYLLFIFGSKAGV